MLNFPQDSIRRLDLSNDIILKQAAAEESEVQDPGALAKLLAIELRRNALCQCVERHRPC